MSVPEVRERQSTAGLKDRKKEHNIFSSVTPLSVTGSSNELYTVALRCPKSTCLCTERKKKVKLEKSMCYVVKTDLLMRQESMESFQRNWHFNMAKMDAKNCVFMHQTLTVKGRNVKTF